MSDLRPRSATRLLNKFFKRFCSDEELWKRMYHNRWLQADDDAPSSKKKRQSWHLSYIMRHFVDRVRFPHTLAQSAYSPRYLQNWRTNNKRLACTFTGHAGTVYCLQFDDEKLVTGSTDATIKVWDLKGQVRHSLTGHTARIRCLRYNDTMLASGSVVRPCTCTRALAHAWPPGPQH